MNKLREKINALVPIEFGGMQEPLLSELEQITDDFTDEFAEWMSALIISNYASKGRWYLKGEIKTTSELRQYFKENIYGK